jgi:SNF2 family DNA or RNA helicase
MGGGLALLDVILKECHDLSMSATENLEFFDLRSYQEEAVDWLLHHRRGILGLAPGVGKTPTALVALQQAGPWRTLILCPKTMVAHWVDLAAAWYPELRCVDGTGSQGKRQHARTLVAGRPDRPTALVMGYEAARTDVEALVEITWGAMICDESHRLKSRGALISKVVNRLSRHPRMWWWGLTGTPAPNRPEELWSQLHIIDRARFSSYWRWVEAHCVLEPIYRAGRPIPHARAIAGLQEGAVERIRSQLDDVLFYRTLEECLPDLPAVTYTTVTVDLDATERRIYDDMHRRGWSQIAIGDGDDAEEILLQAPNEVAKMTRLRQIVSNIEVLREDGEPGSKVRAAAELAADLEPAQVVVLTWSRSAAEAVSSLVGGEFIHGGVPTDERKRILDSFSRKELRILSGTLSTLGEGLDGMQVAHHMIRLDRDWTPARNEQGLARIRRSGQASEVIFCWDITAADTLDAVVERALRAKEDVLEAVLKSL